MKVKELIEKLFLIDQDLEVCWYREDGMVVVDEVEVSKCVKGDNYYIEVYDESIEEYEISQGNIINKVLIIS